MRLEAALLSAVALALGACTTTDTTSADPTSSGRDCFRAEQASGYEVVDDHNIRVRVGPSRSYTMHTSWNANDLDWTQRMELRSDRGWICTGDVFGQVEVIGGTPRQSYPIQTVTRDPPPPGQEGS
ncbi:MAG TPA: DUF6491 family protein [Candidatus Binatia bacterium]|nr:DUF6491 family protein [Candidatus Binatia bacterium]